MRDMIIPRSTEFKRQQLDIFSKGYAHLSVDAGTTRHAHTLDSFLSGKDHALPHLFSYFRQLNWMALSMPSVQLGSGGLGFTIPFHGCLPLYSARDREPQLFA
jgi:hypothetical protein